MRLHIFFHSYMPCRIPAMLYRHIGEILNAKEQSVKHYPLDNQCVTRVTISYKEICVFAGCGMACAPMCGACRCRFFAYNFPSAHLLCTEGKTYGRGFLCLCFYSTYSTNPFRYSPSG